MSQELSARSNLLQTLDRASEKQLVHVILFGPIFPASVCLSVIGINLAGQSGVRICAICVTVKRGRGVLRQWLAFSTTLDEFVAAYFLLFPSGTPTHLILRGLIQV